MGNKIDVTPESMKQLSDALAVLSEDDFKEILSEVDPVTWTETKRVLKGESFSFDQRNYLLQPYRDEFPHIIFMKGRQVEMSEFSMNWLLRKLDKYPYTTGLHAFPRATQAQKFSKQRLDSAIRDSKYINHWYDDRNSEQMMRKFTKEMLDNGLSPYNFYILGATWESHKDTVGDASRGISLDFIVYDERQDHPNDVETVLGEGASHSKYKQTLTLGTPKLPGIQFDQQWEVSNKMYWHVQCHNCGREAPITMENVLEKEDEEGEYYYGCPACRTELNRNIGRWLETNPQKKPEYHGYHINQLMVCWITANEIMRKKNSVTYPKRRFYNEVLGESYGGDDIPITIAMLMECGKNDYKLGDTVGEPLYAGVDWGASSWCILQNKQHRLIDCFVTNTKDPREHPKELARFLSKYKPHVKKVVCDAGPDITRFYSLKDELKKDGICREVFACYYATPPAKTEVQWNEKENNVTVGRSEAIEQVIDEIHDCKFVLPGRDLNVERVDTLIEHFTNIAAEKAQSRAGNEYIMYVNTGPDHFLHAKVYANIASGGLANTPVAGVAAPVVNPRKEEKKSGVVNLSKTANRQSSVFPTFSRRRH
jgi:hypothetical protein